MKRRIVLIAALCGVVLVAQAGLPLLALVEPAWTVASGLVLQSIGRQAVLTVGVAANDASWVTAASLASRAVGILRLVGAISPVTNQPVVYEIPTQADTPIPKPAAQSGRAKVPAGLFHMYQATTEKDSPAISGTIEEVAAGMHAWYNRAWVGVGGLPSPRYVIEVASYYPDRKNPSAWIVHFEYPIESAYEQFYVRADETPVPDGVKPFIRTVDGFSPDGSDPDWTADEKVAFDSPKKLRFKSADAAYQLDVGVESGKTVVKSATAVGGDVRVRQLDMAQDAAVLSVLENILKNTTIADVAASSGSGAGTSEPIVFPTDYARQGEAALAANTVKSAIDSLKDAPSVDNPVVSTPSLSGAQDSFYGNDNKVIGLLGWQVPGFTGVCPTADINFDWKEFSYHGRFDSHCAYADQFRATAAVIFDALWVLVAFFIVLGA